MKAAFCAVVILGGALAKSLAQCEGSSDRVPIYDPSVETVGGITYLHFSYDVYCPQVLWRKPPVVQGTNVHQAIFLVHEYGYCTQEFPPTVFRLKTTLVIGRLDPGNYLLLISTPYFPFAGSPLDVIASIPFTVPEPGLTLLRLPSEHGAIAFQVRGVSNINYRVEATSNLTNWTTVRTVAGPFNMTNRPTASTFYRVVASDRVSVCQW